MLPCVAIFSVFCLDLPSCVSLEILQWFVQDIIFPEICLLKLIFIMTWKILKYCVLSYLMFSFLLISAMHWQVALSMNCQLWIILVWKLYLYILSMSLICSNYFILSIENLLMACLRCACFGKSIVKLFSQIQGIF